MRCTHAAPVYFPLINQLSHFLSDLLEQLNLRQNPIAAGLGFQIKTSDQRDVVLQLMAVKNFAQLLNRSGIVNSATHHTLLTLFL